MTPYQNDHSRLADNLRQRADALATQAKSYLDKLAAAKAEVATAEAAFLASFSTQCASALADAKSKVATIASVVDSLNRYGGPDEVRNQALLAPAVWTALKQGFDRRVADLSKLLDPQRKKLAQLRGALTEQGANVALIEIDPTVALWRQYGEAIGSAISSAVYEANYCATHGEGHKSRAKTFDQLYSVLVAAFPEKPAV